MDIHPSPSAGSLQERMASLRLMAFDVDGVLTDGRLWYAADGSELKSFNAHDGHGIKMLRDGGIKVAIITSRRSPVVEQRARELGIHYCFQGVPAKLSTFNDLLAELNLVADQAGYMGDDLLDLPVLIRAGFSASVPDAPAAVRSRVHHITRKPGGGGAVREVCELILNAQGKLDGMIAEYLA
jgi:3-deoxy-D-manno-octulosonate 8-phosphate phosphatase (KDO 8-P phosphatase)